MNDEFDGFSINIFMDEDGDWMAHLLELPSVSAFGNTTTKAIRELKIAWSAFKESLEKNGLSVPIAPSKKEYSGQFNVRIDKRMHRAIAMEAARAGVSLNALIAQKLSDATVTNRNETRQSGRS